MAITPVQQNIDAPKTTYRDAKQPIKTSNLIHPLPAEGHLVHDTILSVPRFWIKDIAYDMKAIKDGLSGKANDHQTGKLNDVGLKLGGIGIATYLASRTTDPRARLMEYVGLGAFLASMSLYPLLAINAPSRIVQGFDIGKEYIDDQGRKKSVLQDGNYIPFDMYRGEYVGEDLDIIGDRMGIPRNIKNRNELTKEQIRKIAIQNNTLWMLGAGFATPVMTALMCCGLERVLTPAMEYLRNSRYNSKISSILDKTSKMALEPDKINSNNLSKKITSLLTEFKDKELPKEEFDKLINVLSDGCDNLVKQGIKEDIDKLLKTEKSSFVLSENFADDVINIIKETSTGRQNTTLKEVFSPTKSQIESALKNAGSDGKYISQEQLYKFKEELRKMFGAKIELQSVGKDALYMEENNIIDKISKNIQKNKSSYVSENGINKIADFAKVLGEFKDNNKVLSKCESFKVEYSPETVLARSYKRFENAIFEVLDIKYKDLKQMKESDKFTQEIIDKKLNALVKNEQKYQKAIEKIAKVMDDMDKKLHGASETDSHLKDLISAYENNYNNTAKRINNIDKNMFTSTINKLIKEDVNAMSEGVNNTIKDRKELVDIIDSAKKPFIMDMNKDEATRLSEYATENSKGVGSSKEMNIARIIERIQDIKNGQFRLLHTFDIYKREIPATGYEKAINDKLKDVLLTANSTKHTLKLGTDNNPKFYEDIMNAGWNEVKPIEKSTEKALGHSSVKTSFERYIRRFKDIIGNNDIDFTKPEHRLDHIVGNSTEDVKSKCLRNEYTPDALTRQSKFNLVSQNPVDFFRKASKTRFENQKWLRTASAIGGSVIAATVLAQFCFGKIKNPHNIIMKQVSNDDTHK